MLYKIDKLKGTANWSRFEYEMKAVWVIDGVWDVVHGRKARPIHTKPEKSTNAAEPAATATYNAEMDEWTKGEEDREDATDKWDMKNEKAMARLVFYTEEGPRQHIKNLTTCSEQWKMLKKIYGVSDLATRSLALSKIARMESASYKGIQEYSEAIKKQHTILTNMGCGLPAWVLSTFFQLGLEDGLEPYTFQLIQAAKASGKELEIDDIASALSEHDNRLKLSEDTAKVLAAKFGKQDKANQDKKKKKSEKAEKAEKLTCSHCDMKGHLKDKCFYLVKEKRPRNWKPNKEELSIEYIDKKKASASKTVASEGTSHEHASSFKVINMGILAPDLGDGKEDAVYMDSASDVHTLWDRSKFEDDYTPSSGTISGIEGQTLQVHGRGTVYLPALIDGEIF